jgi:hypothetical protein
MFWTCKKKLGKGTVLTELTAFSVEIAKGVLDIILFSLA